MNYQRLKQLKFNIKNNDLHAQIATFLDLVRQDAESKGWNKKSDKAIKGIVGELMYLHENCEIFIKKK